MRKLLPLLSFCALPLAALAQSTKPAAEVRRYAIEVAGLRVGTVTVTHQLPAGPEEAHTLVSAVKVSFLFCHLKIYCQVMNRFRSGQLMPSTVETHTNQGDFQSRTE
jgi:hypothetical protein